MDEFLSQIFIRDVRKDSKICLDVSKIHVRKKKNDGEEITNRLAFTEHKTFENLIMNTPNILTFFPEMRWQNRKDAMGTDDFQGKSPTIF